MFKTCYNILKEIKIIDLLKSQQLKVQKHVILLRNYTKRVTDKCYCCFL